jgi:hypothetical protein
MAAAIIEELVFAENLGQWYPADENSRAKSCPMPEIKNGTFVRPKEYVEIEVKGRLASYCWTSCQITDCPAYQEVHKIH